MSQFVRRPQQESEHLFKVLVLGEQHSGKTSFIRRYVNQYFSPNYKVTLGVDFSLKWLIYQGTTPVRIQLWDVAGMERFGCMTRVYYSGAHAVFIMFDQNSQKSFEAVLRWKADVDAKIKLNDGRCVPCLLVANKCDLKPFAPDKDKEYFRGFAKQNGFIDCISVSPKANINVDAAGELLVGHLMKQYQQYNDNYQIDPRRTLDTIQLTKPMQSRREAYSKKPSRSCCKF